jgi:polyhydroxyalkanoate synthesis regulator phasin
MQFGELTKNLILAGIGAAASTAEKGKEIVDELVKKGEITVDQGKALNEELKTKTKDRIGQEMINLVDKLSIDQRKALRDKLDELDADENNE